MQRTRAATFGLFTLLVTIVSLSARAARADDVLEASDPDACARARHCARHDAEWRLPRLGRFAWQSLIDIGSETYANAPGVERTARVDAIARFGIRHFRGPELPPATTIVKGVALLGGGGFVYATDGRLRWRADVTVSNSWQAVAKPAPGHVFASVPLSVDVTMAFVGGFGEASNRLELQSTTSVGGWGFYLRGGYDLGGPMQPKGGTLGFGFEANTLTFAKFAGPRVVGAVVAYPVSLVLTAAALWLVAHSRCGRCEAEMVGFVR